MRPNTLGHKKRQRTVSKMVKKIKYIGNQFLFKLIAEVFNGFANI